MSAAGVEVANSSYNPPWWRFFFAMVGPVLVSLSFYLDGALSFISFIVLFGFIPVLEIFVQGSDGNLDEAGERGAAANKAYDVLLFSIVPIQYGLLTYYVWMISQGGLSGVELVGKTLAMGIACGLLGLNVGHELGHRREAFPQFLCKMLYLSTLYMHFFIEHNRGHHANVATDEDAASAARGENLFAFIPRSILGGYRSAWALEAKRLRRRKTSFWSLQNEMIRFQVIQLVALGVVCGVFGWQSSGVFCDCLVPRNLLPRDGELH